MTHDEAIALIGLVALLGLFYIIHNQNNGGLP
jgi:hypothetical protein